MSKFMRRVVVFLLIIVLLPLGRIDDPQSHAKADRVVNESQNKIHVNITGTTTPDCVYTGKPYTYTGAAVAQDANGAIIPNVNLQITYTGNCIDGSYYSNAVAPTDVGEYTMNVAVASDDVNYYGSSYTNFRITKRDLTITANSYSINSGDNAPAYDAVIEGLVSNDYLSDINYICEYNPGKSLVGSYSIVQIGRASCMERWSVMV